jgi:hypothetical protein
MPAQSRACRVTPAHRGIPQSRPRPPPVFASCQETEGSSDGGRLPSSTDTPKVHKGSPRGGRQPAVGVQIKLSGTLNEEPKPFITKVQRGGVRPSWVNEIEARTDEILYVTQLESRGSRDNSSG